MLHVACTKGAQHATCLIELRLMRRLGARYSWYLVRLSMIAARSNKPVG